MMVYNVFKNNYSFLIMICCIVFMSCGLKTLETSIEDPWKKMDFVIKTMPQVNFLEKDYNVKDFGAVGDGVVFNTIAFEKAIKACTSNGGERNNFPSFCLRHKKL